MNRNLAKYAIQVFGLSRIYPKNLKHLGIHFKGIVSRDFRHLAHYFTPQSVLHRTLNSSRYPKLTRQCQWSGWEKNALYTSPRLWLTLAWIWFYCSFKKKPSTFLELTWWCLQWPSGVNDSAEFWLSGVNNIANLGLSGSM